MDTQNNPKYLEKFIRYGILLILFLPLASPLFLAPFGLFLFPDSFGKAIIFRIIIEVVLLMGIYSIIKNGFSFKPRLMLWLFLLLWFVLGMSVIFSFEPHQSMWDLQYRSLGFFFYSHLFIFLFLIIYFIKQQKTWDRIFQIMIYVAGVVSLMGILQRFGIYIKPEYISVTSLTRPGSTLGNPNSFGSYLVILLPITFLYLLKPFFYVGESAPHIKVRRIIVSIIFILEIAALIITSSRAAMLGLTIAAILFASFYPFNRPAVKKIILGILIFVILFSAIGIWFDFLNDIAIFGRFSRLITTSGSTRLMAWQSGIKSFFERPIFGFGLENFAIAFDRNYNPLFGTLPGLTEHWWGRAHNFLIEWLTTIGIIGFMVYFLIYRFIFTALGKIARRKENDQNLRVTSAALISVFGGYLTYNFFNFDVPVNLAMIFVVFGYTYFVTSQNSNVIASEAPNLSLKPCASLGLGLNDKRTVQDEKKQSHTGLPRRPALFVKKAGLLAMTIGISLSLWNYNLKPFFINAKANEIETRFFSDTEKSFNDYAKVLEKSSYIDHDLNLRFYFNAHKYATWLGQNNRQEEAVIKRKILIKKLEQNLNFKPYYTRNYIFLGDSYTYLVTLEKENKKQNFKLAKKYYSKAIELSPERQEGLIGLAQLYRSVSQFDKSIKILEDIISMNDKYGPAHFWLAINYFYKNEIEKGTEELKQALSSGYKFPMNNLEIIFKDRPEVLKNILKNINR